MAMAVADSHARPAWLTAPDGHDYLSRILQQVALTANSSLDLDEVLERLARLTLQAIPGDRCAIFLLDPSGKLVPTMAVGQVPNEPEFRRFLQSAPIELKSEPARWDAFSKGRALYFQDLKSSPLVPQEFARAFRARRALVMPLVARDERLGLLSVDWLVPHHDCTEEEIGLVEAIGAYVALAVRNARLFEHLARKARTLERLVELARVLNSAASLASLLQLACSAFEELMGTSSCSINLVEGCGPPQLRTATAGHSSVKSQSGSAERSSGVRIIPRHSKELYWVRQQTPLYYPDLERSPIAPHVAVVRHAASAVVFPLSRPEGPLGYVLATFPVSRRPSPEALATGQALAELVATATARASLHHELRRRLQRVEILHRLSDVVAGAAELAPTLRKLNEVLPPELGMKLQSVALANADLRDALGAQPLSDQHLAALRSWRAIIAKGQTSPRSRRSRGGVLVPLTHRRRVLGVLTLSVHPHALEPADDDLLLAIGSGCAEVVYKAGLQRELAESERRLALIAERERIARDLHDSVGQLLTGLGMRLAEYAEVALDPAWRERLEELRDLASRGSREIRDAIQSLLFLQVRRKGLAKSLRELARKFEATTGIKVDFRVSGAATSLATVAEDALFRVAHEALMNVERHSAATSVTLTLTYSNEIVTVVVVDEGVGLGDRNPFGDRKGHFGLPGLRRLLEEVGGELELWDVVPNGVRVEGRVRIRSRARSGRCR